MLKFYDELYVGFQKERYRTTENQRILAFATPKDDTTAGKKRVYTVDSWRDKKIPAKTVKNEPLHGFEIVDFATRYTTSNKLIRVKDPRGFELEISVENLIELVSKPSSVVVGGKFSEPLVWGREDNLNWLTSTQHPEYIDRNKVEKKLKSSEVKPGDYFVHPAHANVFYRYEGRFYPTKIKIEAGGHSKIRSVYPSWSDSYKKELERAYFSDVRTIDTKFKKSVLAKDMYHIFTEIISNEMNELTSVTVHIRKSLLKDLKPIDSSKAPNSVREKTVPITETLIAFSHKFRDWSDSPSYSIAGNGLYDFTHLVFHESKDKSSEWSITPEEVFEYYKNNDRDQNKSPSYYYGGYNNPVNWNKAVPGKVESVETLEEEI